MDDWKDITCEFIEWLESRNTKIAKKVLKKLDEDIVMIIDYGAGPVMEKVASYVVVPDYVYDQFKLFEKDYIRKAYNREPLKLVYWKD